jgi:hypothetical protein
MGYQKLSDTWRHAEIATADKPATLGALGALGGVRAENANANTSRTGIRTRPITRRPIPRNSQICPVRAPKPPKPPKVGTYARVLATLEIRCPDHIETGRWHQAVEDGKHFLSQWGEQAEALGWTSRDLFGLHTPPAQPHPSYSRLSRYDATGLVWLLRGRPVVALTEATAAIQGPTGAITVYRRHNKPALGPLGDSLDDFEPPFGGDAA